MKTLEDISKILKQREGKLRRKYGVVIIGIFGSYAKINRRPQVTLIF